MQSLGESHPCFRIAFFARDSKSSVKCRGHRLIPEYLCVITASHAHLEHFMVNEKSCFWVLSTYINFYG